jgi:hypothetical protein
MRMYREQPEQAPAVVRNERRKDFFTRAIISGLQEMTADLEKLPESEARTAALAAVARYGKTIAAAIELRKNEALRAQAAADTALLASLPAPSADDPKR